MIFLAIIVGLVAVAVVVAGLWRSGSIQDHNTAQTARRRLPCGGFHSFN
jgi:hypothetical protein